ncbi:hypothetical protein [Helicobacter heilmannii]|uniref:hypothetical protein n=1 Tax=Helicobacter heilmannii TaxID=35817 RepID=UPI0006A03FC2|nr:hypothetical protein [Helicobacter heilmannii]CRF45916.1 hypothetical protein HHE014_08970 [Helicobacter heilmannii]
MFWFLWFLCALCLQALTIQTLEDLPLKQKGGDFSGAVVYKNTAQKQLIIEGTYQLKGNQITLQALWLKKLPLKKSKKSTQTKAKSTTPLKDLKATQDLGAILPDKIHKHTRIYFKDPSPAKMAQILGIEYQDYIRFSPQEKSAFLNPIAPQSMSLQAREEREQTLQDRESKTNPRSYATTPKTYSTRTRSTSSRRTRSTRARSRSRSAASSLRSTRSTSSRTRGTSARSTRSTANPNAANPTTTRERSIRSSTSSRHTASSSTRSRSRSTRRTHSTRRTASTQEYSQNQNFNQPYNQAQSTQPQHDNPYGPSYNPPSQHYPSSTSAPTYNPSPTYSPSYMPLPLNYPQTSTSPMPSPTSQTPSTSTTPKALQPTPTSQTPTSTLMEISKETTKPTESQDKPTEPTEKKAVLESTEGKKEQPTKPSQEPPTDKEATKEATKEGAIEGKNLELKPQARLEVPANLGMGGVQEEACGVWSYDDEKLQAKRPSVMHVLDKASGQLLRLGPCDFNADKSSGKGAGITLPYTELPPRVEVLGPTTTTHTFILSKANYSQKLCYKAKTRQCLHLEPNTTTKWTSTYSTTTTRTIRTYQRPPQVGQDIPTEYSTTSEEVKAERKSDIQKNDLHLSPKFLEFVEVYEKEYLDSQVVHSKEYLEWRDRYVRPKQGTCQEYQIEELIKDKRVRPSIHNTRILCVKSGDYLLKEEDK